MATFSTQRRRGLPRTPGGEPWPPPGEVPERVQALTSGEPSSPALTPSSMAASEEQVTPAEQAPSPVVVPAAQGQAPAPTTAAPASDPVAAAVAAPAEHAEPSRESPQVTLRRGLPRLPGGDPWPPEGFAPLLANAGPASAAPTQEHQPRKREFLGQGSGQPVAAVSESSASTPAIPAGAPAVLAETSPVRQPAAAESAAASVASKPDPKATTREKPQREPIVIGSRTLGQWSKLVGLIIVGGVLTAGILVLAARGLTTLPGVPEFLERYTGVYEIPNVAEEGLPWWVRWTHYMNFFFMLLIIRTGLLVRTQQKPDAFYTPKKGGGKKVSIYLWLHTSIDILWMLNGLIFVVALFATGHWQRIVPTSWEVFPNALSSMLQYMTLEWPTYQEGWVYYNSLQELMYFTVVFIAAPLAAITGLRMSEWWPKDAEKLNEIYRAPVARAIHFPVMLFFVLFVIMHVIMVLATGALKNLNHMFYGAPEPTWMGFWFFAGGLVLAIGTVIAARPLVIAPIASLFGKISNR